jgi:hypothetical protein
MSSRVPAAATYSRVDIPHTLEGVLALIGAPHTPIDDNPMEVRFDGIGGIGELHRLWQSRRLRVGLACVVSRGDSGRYEKSGTVVTFG